MVTSRFTVILNHYMFYEFKNFDNLSYLSCYNQSINIDYFWPFFQQLLISLPQEVLKTNKIISCLNNNSCISCLLLSSIIWQQNLELMFPSTIISSSITFSNEVLRSGVYFNYNSFEIPKNNLNKSISIISIEYILDRKLCTSTPLSANKLKNQSLTKTRWRYTLKYSWIFW